MGWLGNWGLDVLRWRPSHWAGLAPNGLGKVKPNHYGDLLRAFWENRRQLPFAWRILRNGVCDGCALGTTGMRDFTLPGVHLCTVRTNLLSLNTMDPLDPARLRDVAGLHRHSSKELRQLGRLGYPMVRRAGDAGFGRASWGEALRLIGDRLRTTDPHRVGFYLTSRGITNEAYYVAQKVARFLGTNNIDNSSRVCHAPSTTGLKQTLGVAASTCSYKDWLGTDLLVFVGSDVPNNQPVTTKYIYHAKRRGTKVLTVNPYREPGLERYWIPSIAESALFGTRLTDEFFSIHTGGDLAFFNGVLKHLVEVGGVDQDFVERHTSGFDDLKTALDEQSWEALERYSGATEADMRRFADLFRQATSAVIVWSMGITQHRFGVENVKVLVNLALARGFVGRENCGLMAIRGHSGVQGGAEMGAVPWQFPTGEAVSESAAQRLGEAWGFSVPSWRGMSAVEMLDAAHEGQLDTLYSVGGNFLETLPEPDFIKEALARVPFRVHQDIVVTSQMLVDPADTVVLLPARTRYEQRGGGTETSTERRVLFSPEIPGRRVAESRAEFDIFMDVAKHVAPDRWHSVQFADGAEVRREISRLVPYYEGMSELCNKGDSFQWGGPQLCYGGRFPTEDGRGRFTSLFPPEVDIPEGQFLMSTRRGRQFNSMVQADRDPLTGARRADVIMAPEDAVALGILDGDAIVVKSDVGELRGTCKFGPVKRRNVQVHWPEANLLLRRGVTDPVCGIPDYNTTVSVEPTAAKS